MAETLVLANISIDASGVVSGIAQSQSALATGEKGVVKFSNTMNHAGGSAQGFVSRLLNVNGALKTVARSLGLAGAVLALAAGIRRLASDVLDASAAWQKFRDKFEDVYNWLIKGETAMDALSRKMGEIAKAGGFGTATSTFVEMEKLTKAIRDIQEQLKTVAPGSAFETLLKTDLSEANRQLRERVNTMNDLGISMSKVMEAAKPEPTGWQKFWATIKGGFGGMIGSQGMMNEANAQFFTAAGPPTIAPPVGGGPTGQSLLQLAGLKTLPERARDLREIGQAVKFLTDEFQRTGNISRFIDGMDKLQAGAVGLHATTQELEKMGLALSKPEAPDFFKTMGIPNQEEFDARVNAIREALTFIVTSPQAIPTSLMETAIANLRDELEKLGFTAEQVKAVFDSLPGTWEQFTSKGNSFKDLMREWVASLKPAEAAFELFQQGLTSVAEGVANAFLEQGVTLRQAVVEILKTIARMCIVYAAMFFAAGVVASTGIGMAAVQGTPPQLFAAAQLFMAAGIAAGAASIALGRSASGHGGGGGGNGNGGQMTAAGATSGGPNVTVTVNGSILGTDPNELARSIQKLITTAQEDNA